MQCGVTLARRRGHLVGQTSVTAGGGVDQILSAPFTAGETLTLPARDALICDVSAPAPMGKGKPDATVTITPEGGSTPIGTAVIDEDGDSRARLLVRAAAGDGLLVGQADAAGISPTRAA